MRKFLILTLLLTALTLPASAEQPAAEEYRQMFRSGNFYVECQMFRPGVGGGWIIGGDKFSSVKMVFAGQNGRRMYRATSAGTMNSNVSRDGFDSINRSLLNVYSTPNQRAFQHEDFKTKKWPDVMYKDGKYYRFSTSGLALRGISSWMGCSKDVSAVVLSEKDLNLPTLNPYDEWNFIREDLSLPDELAIFYWDEPFRDNFTAAPKYNGSSRRTVDDKEYDCDQYLTEIKSVSGSVIAQEAYNALYDGGKLVRVQRYILYDGKEIYVQELVVKNLTATVPKEAFAIGKAIKVYAADKGDMKDLLEQPELVETLGGN